MNNQFTSVLTGKGPSYGGSLIRPQASGFGCVYFAEEMLKRRGLAGRFDLEFRTGQLPWSLSCDIALPCATQNELDVEAARTLLRNGCICVAEGANMPTTLEAMDLFIEADILFAAGKASNAGGVAVSGLEMSQNAMRLAWTGGEVDSELHAIMQSIHHACVHYGEEDGRVNYVKGANIAGFVKVADAMLAQGVV